MPPITYNRLDFVVSIRAGEDGEPVIEAGGAVLDAREPLAKALADAIREWGSRLDAGAQHFVEPLPRLVLDIQGRELARVAWEEMLPLPPGHPPHVIVRRSAVPARDAAIPWTLPLRILHVKRRDPSHVRTAVSALFGGLERGKDAVRMRELGYSELDGWAPYDKWPTAEIVHLDGLPALGENVRRTSADASKLGTLGWFSRFTDTAQTRLLVLHLENDADRAEALELGAALVSRGGPAVLVFGPDPSPDRIFRLYDLLIHDRPLDWIAADLQRDGLAVLFAGAGREEAIRVSGPGARLMELAGRLEANDPAAEAELADAALYSDAYRAPEERQVFVKEMRTGLSNVRMDWDRYAFELRESGGLIPYSAQLERLRESARGTPKPAKRLDSTAPPAPAPPTLEAAPSARWLNTSLWEADGEAPRSIPQAGARLAAGRTYHLGIDIGPRDEAVKILGASAILYEKLKVHPEAGGTWIEVAVTGIGFDVLGEPVQALWLPREGGTEQLRFAVVPREAGVAVLRVILYHDNNVVQTYRLAALVAESADSPADAGARLAEALGVPADDVKGEGWLARMEFSSVSGTDGIATRAPRAVSIVANDIAGTPVVTVKTAGDYDVRFPGNVATDVQKLRDLLSSIASDSGAYLFGTAAGPNAGGDDQLKAALISLAEAGWSLYTQLIGKNMRVGLQEVLHASPGQTIKIAHVLLEKVIPWALVYDRYFSPNPAAGDDGQVPAVDACLAALPQADGTPSPAECGKHPGCVLHPDQLAQRAAAGLPPLTPKSVACPRHFWGFQHIVEISPKVVRPNAGPVAEADVVRNATPARFLAAFNDTLSLARPHLGRLSAPEHTDPGAAVWESEFVGTNVRNQLEREDLDLIYLYCHARGGAADPARPPCLEFSANDTPAVVTPADLVHDESTWTHNPLVILNGCGTVGFSPDALSPFIPILVDDRGAAGLLGTEISVWEQLAGEFAEHFLRAFISGEKAGAALVQARRRLLAQRNPLGLAYTLYANSDLRFASPQSPMAARVTRSGAAP
jgi:hypothetical protein